MADTRSLLEAGWSAIQDRFLATLRTVAEGGSPGAWSNGLLAITGTDWMNASTGRRYRGPFNRGMLHCAIGSTLDRRVATACQLGRMGFPDPAAHGIKAHAMILTPIKLSPKDEEEQGEDERERVVFRPAGVFSIGLLRAWEAEDGTKPWEGLPSIIELPPAEWTAQHEAGVLSIIPDLARGVGATLEVALVKSPHVTLRDGHPLIRLPDPAQQIGDEAEMLANRLSSAIHECAHATGFGSCPATEGTKRVMTGGHGSIDYAREELVAEITAARMMQILGLEESPGFLAKKCAYVGGWAKPLLAGGQEAGKLLRSVLEDSEKVVSVLVAALEGNAFFSARLALLASNEQENRIPDAAEPMASEIPDWRDADGLDALTPAQMDRAAASYAAKKGKGAAIASGSLADFILRSQRKRARKGGREMEAAA
ncbi:protein of unknown function (plasmid) [Magnetospirillum sp. XM-1]|uniref:zincin-like metallopeptidase domain-containing protein n=1 Tax=Magnetospirillum sp. XM-1 TaxID=1663591 RepID=UPI00073DD6CA|nr:zincin-like metallopeptidase domain-containing protein [Magnetospirillum sp. XM-1]CUW41874.1 protein of unknown function [Magnetospirillum sp. XM-1]